MTDPYRSTLDFCLLYCTGDSHEEGARRTAALGGIARTWRCINTRKLPTWGGMPAIVWPWEPDRSRTIGEIFGDLFAQPTWLDKILPPPKPRIFYLDLDDDDDDEWILS